MFSTSCSSLKPILPTGTATLPPLSLRNSILPALNSRTADVMSVVTVPERGEGIKPRGPEHAAQGPDDPHHVGRGQGDVEVHRPSLDLLRQVVGPHDVGAGGPRLLGVLALGKDRHAHALADAVRQRHRAADVLIGLLGVDPQVGRDLDGLVELGRVERLQEPDRVRKGNGPVDLILVGKARNRFEC